MTLEKTSEYLPSWRSGLSDPNGPIAILFSRVVRRSLTSDEWPLLRVFRLRTGLCDQGFGLQGLTGWRETLTRECICQTCGRTWTTDPKRKPLQLWFIRTALWTTTIHKKTESMCSRPASFDPVRSLMWRTHLNSPPKKAWASVWLGLASVSYAFITMQNSSNYRARL